MSAPPDLLRRIVARRRERVEEALRGAAPAGEAGPEQSIGTRSSTEQSMGTRSLAEQSIGTRSLAEQSIGTRSLAERWAASQSWTERAEPLTAAENPFLAALRRPRSEAAAGGGLRAAIIAEVKMGSPRLGSLAGRVDPLAQARIYAGNGAAALSVVVEPDFFHGSYDLLAACREAARLPAVAKDFVVHPVQLAWARAAGADAVLLIASLLSAEDLGRYARLARGLGLAPLVETHGVDDIAKLGEESWELVGVNNRDLTTFAVDLEHSIALLPALPEGALKVAESGIRDALDVALLADSGFDACLVGESLLLAADPALHLRQLAGVAHAR
jgi:indole-3-glycerol phosphate synthase